MSTNSTIAIKQGESIISIYCHWDGYPEHNGKMLRKHYTDATKVMELMKHGGLSSLGPNIGTKHSFENRPLDECTFYFRDRGDNGMEAATHLSVKEWKEYYSSAEYGYLFNPESGKWRTYRL